MKNKIFEICYFNSINIFLVFFIFSHIYSQNRSLKDFQETSTSYVLTNKTIMESTGLDWEKDKFLVLPANFGFKLLPHNFLFLRNIDSLSAKESLVLSGWMGNPIFDSYKPIYNNGFEKRLETSLLMMAKEELIFFRLKQLYPKEKVTPKGGGMLYIFLPELKILDSEITKNLAKWKGDALYLQGITSFDAKTAENLSKWSGNELCLDGLTSVDTEVAQHLSKWKCKNSKVALLSLRGISTIDKEVAFHLSQWKGNFLLLDGLKFLGNEEAINLAKWKGKFLSLNGLQPNDASILENIAKWNAEIVIAGGEKLVPKK